MTEARLLLLSAQPAVKRNVHDTEGEARRMWQLLDDRIDQWLAHEAEASRRHYLGDDCGDPQHDAILAAWYANAEKLLKTSRIDLLEFMLDTWSAPNETEFRRVHKAVTGEEMCEGGSWEPRAKRIDVERLDSAIHHSGMVLVDAVSGKQVEDAPSILGRYYEAEP
jgi:hypothetical protein